MSVIRPSDQRFLEWKLSTQQSLRPVAGDTLQVENVNANSEIGVHLDNSVAPAVTGTAGRNRLIINPGKLLFGSPGVISLASVWFNCVLRGDRGGRYLLKFVRVESSADCGNAASARTRG
jgi:hypothetical protein